MVTDITDVLPMVIDVYPMVTDVNPIEAEESSVANPQKVAKIDEKSEKWVGNTAFVDELPVSLVLSGTIGCICEVPYKILVTDSKVEIGDPKTSVANSNLSIETILSSASIGHRIYQA